MAIAAAVLTPNVKMKWLRVIQKTSPDCTEEQISKRVIEVICTLFKNGFSYNATDVPNLNNDNSFYDFDDDGNFISISWFFKLYIIFLTEDDVSKTPVKPTESNGFKNAISNQFYAYLNDPDPGPEIWTKYNVLKEAFLLCNTPLTSSAPVERLFSFAGIINTPRRNSLSDFSFEKLVLMKSNVNFLWIIYKQNQHTFKTT